MLRRSRNRKQLAPPVAEQPTYGTPDAALAVWLVRLLGLVVVAGLVLGVASVVACRGSRIPGTPDPACDAIPDHVAEGFSETLQTIVALLAGSRLSAGR